MPKYRLELGSIQYKFNQDRKKIQFMGGGFGNGKTAAGCVKIIQLAIDYPGSNILVGRESYAKLNDTVRKEFYKWVPRDAVARWPTTTDNTMILKNGSIINFRYIAQRGKKTADGQTTSNLLSATYDAIFIDQIEDPLIVYKDFLDLMGRLRGATPYKGNDPTMPLTGPRWLILTANPTANWVYTKLVKPYHQWKATGIRTDELLWDEQRNEPMLSLYEGSTYENAGNLEPDFLSGLEATYRGQMKKRYLMGEWAAYEGLVYPDFSLDSHVIPHGDMMDLLVDSFRATNRYEGCQSFDLGISQPSCYLNGFTDDEGRIFIIDGFYEPGMGHSEIAGEIRRIQDKYLFGIEYRDPIWADPAIFRRNQLQGKGTATTVGKLLQEKGLYLKPGQNDIKNGIVKVNGYLAIRPDFHYLDNTRPGPGIYFSDHLGFIADEFQGYYWKTNEVGERIDEPMGKNDHAMDALKYLVSRLPDPSVLNYYQPRPLPEHMKWQEVQ